MIVMLAYKFLYHTYILFLDAYSATVIIKMTTVIIYLDNHIHV